MSNKPFTGPTSIGELREALKYRSREAMNNNWTTVFDGEILPDDHIQVPVDQVITFVKKIAIPQRGRPGTITGAAQRLLKSWKDPNPESESWEDYLEEPKVSKGNEESIHPIAFLLKEVEGFNKEMEVGEELLSDNVSEVPEDIKPENPGGSNVSPDFKKVEDRPSFWERIRSLSGLDWVYLVTVGIVDYGLVVLLKEMGLAAGIVYTLISFHALAMAKDRKAQVTASRGITAVWLMEMLAFFVHLTLFNRRLWASIEELPFTVDDISDESRPFWIAVIIAVLFSAAGIYAVSTTLALLKEGIEAEEYERNHGIKY